MKLTEGSVAVHVGDGTVKPFVFSPIEGQNYAPGDVIIALNTDTGPGSPMGSIFFQGNPAALEGYLEVISAALQKFRTDTAR